MALSNDDLKKKVAAAKNKAMQSRLKSDLATKNANNSRSAYEEKLATSVAGYIRQVNPQKQSSLNSKTFEAEKEKYSSNKRKVELNKIKNQTNKEKVQLNSKLYK